MAREYQEVWAMFTPLYSDIKSEDSYFSRRPLLAHYTTLNVLEQICRNNELWLGNPLFMNDIEEVRFGINEGTNSFLASSVIEAALPAEDRMLFEEGLRAAYSFFDAEHAFDTYILCLSEHAEGDVDGLLSMWRGYGDSGKGVALVLDGSSLAETQDTPLIIAKVTYATEEERRTWFDKCAAHFAEIVRAQELSGDEIRLAAHALFARLRMFSLFTKHLGFQEENEWRLAYMPELDHAGLIKRHLHYYLGPRGVEPKLKLKIEPMTEMSDQPLSLEILCRSIILGPSISSYLAQISVKRMLETLDRPELASRVVASRIPYRAIP